MIAERRPRRAGVRPLPIAASAGAHLVVLTLLVWRLGTAPELPESPVMSVELAPPRRERPEKPADRRPERATIGRGPASPSRPVAIPAPPPDAAPEAGPVAGGAGVQPTLRSLLGCAPAVLPRLSPEERRRCEDRLATAGARDLGRVASLLDLDRRGEYARNPQAYLNRRPKNGCKARAAGDADHMGREGPAAGIDCAWAF